MEQKLKTNVEQEITIDNDENLFHWSKNVFNVCSIRK